MKGVWGKAKDITPEIYNDGVNAKGVEKRVLIGKKIGAKNYVMRLFTLEPLGFTPQHSHPWEHEVYLISGELLFFDGENWNRVEAGSYIFVPEGVKHQFKNASDKEKAEFICVIPMGEEE